MTKKIFIKLIKIFGVLFCLVGMIPSFLTLGLWKRKDLSSKEDLNPMTEMELTILFMKLASIWSLMIYLSLGIYLMYG